MIASALSYMASTIQQHMPLMGEMLNGTTQELNRCIDNLYVGEHSTFDYLTGKGPLGSYIADHIEMFKLCSKIHRFEGECIHHTNPQVDMEIEYQQIFNYEPKIISTNGKYCDEYDYLSRMVKRIHEFLYLTKPHNNDAFKDLFCDNSINMDSAELVLNYGAVEKSGIYNRKSGFGHTRALLVLVAPIRDTKVALVFDLFNQGFSLQRLYYKVRAENVWVKSSDYSGSWILDGTYEALRKEAESFLAKMNCQLDPDLQPHADNCLTHLKRIDEVVNAFTEAGCANSITDVFKDFELNNQAFVIFTLKLDGMKYTVCKLLVSNPEYRLHIEQDLSTSGHQGKYFDTVTYGEDTKTNLVDSLTTTCYFVQKLERYLAKAMPKLEELYAMAFTKPAEEE